MIVGLVALALLVVACSGNKPKSTTYTVSGMAEDEAGAPIKGVG